MQMLMHHCFVIMLVVVAILAVSMDMGMDVRVFVGMDSITMPVLVGVGVHVFMGVLQRNGVLDHEITADDHNCQRNIELDCRPFTQKQYAKCHAKEWRNGFVFMVITSLISVIGLHDNQAAERS